VLRHQDVLAHALHERPSAGPPYLVGDERADHLGQGSQQDDQGEARVLVRAGHRAGGDRPAEQERQLGGDRDAHGLKNAEKNNGVDGV